MSDGDDYDLFGSDSEGEPEAAVPDTPVEDTHNDEDESTVHMEQDAGEDVDQDADQVEDTEQGENAEQGEDAGSGGVEESYEESPLPPSSDVAEREDEQSEQVIHEGDADADTSPAPDADEGDAEPDDDDMRDLFGDDDDDDEDADNDAGAAAGDEDADASRFKQEDDDAAFARSSMMDDIDAVDDAALGAGGDGDTYGAEADEADRKQLDELDKAPLGSFVEPEIEFQSASGQPIRIDYHPIKALPDNAKIFSMKFAEGIVGEPQEFDHVSTEPSTSSAAVMRWRKSGGQIESNTRLVTWSDGSRQLVVGARVHQVQPLHRAGEAQYVFADCQNEKKVERCYGKIVGRLMVQSDFSRKLKKLRVAKAFQRTTRVQQQPHAKAGPEFDVEAARKKEMIDIRRRQRRRQQKRQREHYPTGNNISRGFLEGDNYSDGDVDGEGEEEYNDEPVTQRQDLDDDEEEEQEERLRRAQRMDDDEDEDEDEDEDDGGGGGGSSQQRKSLDDDDDEDDEDDIVVGGRPSSSSNTDMFQDDDEDAAAEDDGGVGEAEAEAPEEDEDEEEEEEVQAARPSKKRRTAFIDDSDSD